MKPGKTARIAMLAYPDFQMLDVMGPLEVFSRTARWLESEGRAEAPAYEVEVLGLKRGLVTASSGLRVHADRAYGQVAHGIDTLLISGGRGSEAQVSNLGLLRWIRQQTGRVRRLGSVCTGAFLLAAAGVLRGKRATTHWSSCAQLAGQFPDVAVEPDMLYVRQGSIYTSAGVTAGMDLALALVEEDYGRDVALAVARELVVFLRRPGGQSQFSAQLAAQLAERAPINDLQAYIVEHPEADLSVPSLARRVSMSPRNFARVFAREVGVSPARFVASARIGTARRLLEDSAAGIDAVAERSGFGHPEAMRRAFLKSLGVPPSDYRERFTCRVERSRSPS